MFMWDINRHLLHLSYFYFRIPKTNAIPDILFNTYIICEGTDEDSLNGKHKDLTVKDINIPRDENKQLSLSMRCNTKVSNQYEATVV